LSNQVYISEGKLLLLLRLKLEAELLHQAQLEKKINPKRLWK